MTLTLPETALAHLSEIDADLSLAVVRLLASARPAGKRPAAELAMYGRRAVITVKPTPSLERYVGVDLVPLPDGRALITFDQPQTIADLELTLGDALDRRGLPPEDRRLFEAVRTILRDSRRAADVTLLRRSLIVLELNAPRKAKRGARG